ncbi:hypothetical protein FVEN_g6088 [Fusarium venenatum]|nr:hypothetical protein FVEN_g6088 [Fusarium venenatum]
MLSSRLTLILTNRFDYLAPKPTHTTPQKARICTHFGPDPYYKFINNISPTPISPYPTPDQKYAMSDRPSHRGGRGQGSHPRGGRGGGRGGGGAGGAQQERERPKKENILDLAKYMDKQITVKFNGGREAKGTLKGYDALMNLVLDDVHEVVRDDEGNESTRSLGLVVVRGTLLVLVSPVDGSEEIANPFIQTEDD